MVLPYFEEMRRFLISTNMVNFVCDILSDELVGHGQPLPSIREIRGIVGRSVFWTIETLLYSKEYTSAMEVLKKELEDELDRGNVTANHEMWFRKLCDLIDDVHSIKKQNQTIAVYKLRFVDLIRQTLRKSTIFTS
jgi:hypothetical protein